MADQMMSVTIECPTDWLDQFGGTPESFARELRVAAAIGWYRQERVALHRAAEVAGLSRAEFLDALFEANITPMQRAIGEGPGPDSGS